MVKIFIIIILLLFPASGYSALWYVDNAASGTNTGTSWTNAWQSFASINYSSVSCGDTIYISGGATTKTYAERLDVGKSCTAGNVLTYTVGTASPHNGTVKIMGSSGSYWGIRISGKNYITIDGQSNGDGQRHIEVYSSDPSDPGNIMANAVYIGNGTNNDIKYLTIHDTQNTSQGNQCIVVESTSTYAAMAGNSISYSYIYNCQVAIDHRLSIALPVPKAVSYGNILIHHNTIQAYDDGIHSTGGADIYNNDISRSASAVSLGHPDGIQIFGSYVRVYNNYFHDYGLPEAGNSVVYWEPDGGGSPTDWNHNENEPSNFLVYNNVITAGASDYDMKAIEIAMSDSRFLSIKNVQIFNNVINGASFVAGIILAHSGHAIDRSNLTGNYVVNNIFYNSCINGGKWFTLDLPSYVTTKGNTGSWGSGASWVIDYNAVYGAGTTGVTQDGTTYTYANYKTFSSTQAHDVTTDPNLTATWHLNSGSPVIGQAVDASSVIAGLSTDKDGVTRGASWDMGAYEYGTSTPVLGGVTGVGISVR